MSLSRYSQGLLALLFIAALSLTASVAIALHPLGEMWGVFVPVQCVELMSSTSVRCAAGVIVLGLLLGPPVAFAAATWRAGRMRTSELELSIEALPATRHESIAGGPSYSVIPDAAPLAFTLGLKSPRIFVSTGALETLSEDELRAVLTHERCHVDAKDPLRKLILAALRSALRYVPGAARLIDGYLCWREHDADERTVRATGQVRPLQTAFLKMAAAPLIPPAANFTDYAVSRVNRLALGARESAEGRMGRSLLLSSMVFVALPIIALVATEWHLVLG